MSGRKKDRRYGDVHAFVAGFGFNDKSDDCDCKPIEYIAVHGKNDSSYGDANEGNG